MKLSEIIKGDKRKKEIKRALQLLESYGDCEVEYRELDYWNTDHICINNEWYPLAYHFINQRFHCSSLINFCNCSAAEWEIITEKLP